MLLFVLILVSYICKYDYRCYKVNTGHSYTFMAGWEYSDYSFYCISCNQQHLVCHSECDALFYAETQASHVSYSYYICCDYP